MSQLRGKILTIKNNHMKTRILIAVIASAATLLSFSLISGSPKKANQEKVASAITSEPVGGLAVEDIQR